MWGELILGSNVIRNTSGVIGTGDGELMTLEKRADGQLLLTVDVFDAGAARVARLRRNAWTYNPGDAYVLTTAPSSLTLTERTTGVVLLEAKVVSPTRIEVPVARLWTRSGTRLDVFPDRIVIGENTISGNAVDQAGQGIVIAEGQIGLGGDAAGYGTSG